MKVIANIILNPNIKRFLLLFFLLALFIIVSAFSYVNAISTDIENSLFRLHVIANSDSDEDQNLKYIVRDNIIQYIDELSQNLNSKEEVLELARDNIAEIKRIAQETVYKSGYNYNIEVEVGNFEFPTKYYGDISLPAGMYDALRVRIGKAEGKNWWCVMFPPLCFVDVTSGVVPDESKEIMKENLLDEEYRLISDDTTDMKFKFRVVELFQNISMNFSNS